MRVYLRYFYVYIMSNYRRTVLYIGVTSNLIKRVCEHKEGAVESFTQEYNLHDLMYYEIYEDPNNALKREKQLKRWSRKKKDRLIMSSNPELKDLYSTLV